MSAHTKVYDEAAIASLKLRDGLQGYFMQDGALSSWERALLDDASTLYALTEAVAALIRVALRVLGGGRVDRGLMLQVKDALTLLAGVIKEPVADEATSSSVEGEKQAA
jgi:hypothetical protein